MTDYSSNGGNGRPRFQNRFDDVQDYVPGSKPSDVAVPREFFDEVTSLITELKGLYYKNQRLHKAIASLERDLSESEVRTEF